MAITEARPEALPAGEAHGIAPQRHPIWEWLTTTDHKKIGIMYLVNSYFWFGVAGMLAEFMRTELAKPGVTFFDENQFNQLFTMHGTTMIFLFIIPILAGFANYIVPLQIGALDMAFPRVNALSFWMRPLAGIVLYSGYFTGGTASILGAVNFITTLFNMRAPGMTMFRLPLFVWTMLVTSLLVLLATPVI